MSVESHPLQQRFPGPLRDGNPEGQEDLLQKLFQEHRGPINNNGFNCGVERADQLAGQEGLPDSRLSRDQNNSLLFHDPQLDRIQHFAVAIRQKEKFGIRIGLKGLF